MFTAWVAISISLQDALGCQKGVACRPRLSAPGQSPPRTLKIDAVVPGYLPKSLSTEGPVGSLKKSRGELSKIPGKNLQRGPNA